MFKIGDIVQIIGRPHFLYIYSSAKELINTLGEIVVEEANGNVNVYSYKHNEVYFTETKFIKKYKMSKLEEVIYGVEK